jgi:hypothetical protein
VGTYKLSFWKNANKGPTGDKDDTVTGFKNFKIYE